MPYISILPINKVVVQIQNYLIGFGSGLNFILFKLNCGENQCFLYSLMKFSNFFKFCRQMNRAEDVLPWQSGKIPLQIKNAEFKLQKNSF